MRPSAAVRVVLRSADGDARTVLLSPDGRTFSILGGAEASGSSGTVGGLFRYKRDAIGWAQALWRELARPWLLALALVGLGRALSRRDRQLEAGASVPAKAAGGAALALGGLAVCATLPVATLLLEGIPHVQDDVTYLFQAQVFALGRLSGPAPPLPEFFAQEFVLVNGGDWFGKYPPGQPLMLTLGLLVGAPWLVSPLAAGGAVSLTYLTGRRLYGPGVGLVAAAVMLGSPFFLLMSGSMMAHPSGLLWASALLYSVVRCRGSCERWPWALAGATFGMLFITRQFTAAAIGWPLLLALAAGAPRRWRELLPRVSLFLAGLGPPLLFLLSFNWALLGDLSRSPYELWWAFDRYGFGPTVGMHGGHDLANGLANTWANLVELCRHLYGWPPYLTLAFAAVPFAVLSRRRWDWIIAACLVSLVAGYVGYWADGIMYGPRYYYEGLGMLALLTARGGALLAISAPAPALSSPDRAGKLSSPPAKGATTAQVATAALFVVLVATNLFGYLPEVLKAARGYNGVSRARLDAVERANVGPALVFVPERWPDWQPYGSVFPANGPLLDASVVYARDRGSAENRRLMAEFPHRRPYLLRDLELVPLDS